MNRKYRYTIVTLLLATVFILGSTLGMRVILQSREKQLLMESGKAKAKSPVRAWQEWEKEKQTESSKNSNSNDYFLVNTQMENAIRLLNNSTGETLHAPIEGQISMEDAIDAGKDWLAAMEIDKEDCSVNATLSVGKQEEYTEIQLEPYYSFWKIQFWNQKIDTVLYVNAVTGQVWSARMTLYEDAPTSQPIEKLKVFMESAGVQPGEGAAINTNTELTKATLDVKDSLMYAEMEFTSVGLDKNANVEYKSHGVTGDSYAVITYSFKFKE